MRHTPRNRSYSEMGTAIVACDDRDPLVMVDLEVVPQSEYCVLIVNEGDGNGLA